MKNICCTFLLLFLSGSVLAGKTNPITQALLKSIETKHKVKCPVQPDRIKLTFVGYQNDETSVHEFSCGDIKLNVHLVKHEVSHAEYVTCIDVKYPKSEELIDADNFKCR